MEFLLVDDDWIARQSLSNIVRGINGATAVLESEDGEQAWEMLQAGLRPALCCCDVLMPRLDGLGFLQRVRDHPVLRHMPVVLVSSASSPDTVRTGIERGAAGYILKPFLAQQTRATLARVLVESLATQAERVPTTLRRLGIGSAQLLGLLERFLADAREARASAGDTERLRRLHGSALRLGQWRCAGLLRELLDAGRDDAVHLSVLDEVAGLVERQMRRAEDHPKAGRRVPAEQLGVLPLPTALAWPSPMPEPPTIDDVEAYQRDTPVLYFGGATTVFRNARCMFLDQAPADLRAIGEAASRGDVDAARRIAHKLQGSAGTVGAAMLARLCKLLATGVREPGADWIAQAQSALDAYRAASTVVAATA